MGITVSELLSTEFFRDFRVVAGHRGLNREIQGVTFIEAPDSHHWAIGKELVFTSGYVFVQNPDYIKTLERVEHPGHSALVIKRERYLDKVPEELIALYERYGIPLITMPYSIPWMSVVNQVNVAVMNHAILRFHVNTGSRFIGHNQNYKDQKIRSILKTVETEMEFPAFLYDVFEGKSYYSSGNFQRVSERYGLKESDYWNPQTPHTSHTLCDCIQMKRYRLLKGEQAGEPRISWVVIPIQSGDVPQAYFCVMESRKFLDFYDEYSMRIAYMMLQGIYEQLAVARDFSHIGLENLVHMVLESRGADSRKLLDQSEQYGISLEQPRLYVLFSHDHANYDVRGKRSEMMELLRQSALGRSAHLVFLSRTEGLLLLNPQELGETDRKSLSLLIEDYEERLSRKFQGLNWSFAYCCEKKPLGQVHTVVDKYRRLLKIGGLVAPERTIHNYEDFGILTWLTIPDEELLTLRERFHDLTENEKSRELMQTLRIYLENNMNYSLTAEKLFVNVNTIRRRIEKVNELISIDWDNYFERVKIGIMLQLLQE